MLITNADPEHGSSRNLHRGLLDALGVEIVGGQAPTGKVMSIDEIAESHQVSRSVVREVLRVLASMGLVSSTRGVGTVVLPARAWNVFDPQVVRWRLASPNRMAQLRSLAELRAAFEPEAAALAATRGDDATVGALVGMAASLWVAGHQDGSDFIELDVEFHAKVLEASGNEMFASLAPAVGEILRGRVRHHLTPPLPVDEALERHMALARAIQKREPDAARAAARQIVDQSILESKHLWEEPS
ncbi:MAG TPA: FCD domain-containing protein [Propionibacteriaceae bacterium]|nr:FCD domain-containing protein [Propionibacteriaceae bacterium]